MDYTQLYQKHKNKSGQNNDLIPKIINQSPKNTDNLANQQQNSKQKKNSGVWSRNEDLIYLKFLKQNQVKISTQNLRRSTRIFKQLSVILQNKRTPQQCRMHHNKMKKFSKNLNIKKIITFLIKKHNFAQSELNTIEKVNFAEIQNKLWKKKSKGSLLSYQNQMNSCSFKINKYFNLTIEVDLNEISSW